MKHLHFLSPASGEIRRLTAGRGTLGMYIFRVADIHNISMHNQIKTRFLTSAWRQLRFGKNTHRLPFFYFYFFFNNFWVLFFGSFGRLATSKTFSINIANFNVFHSFQNYSGIFRKTQAFYLFSFLFLFHATIQKKHQ